MTCPTTSSGLQDASAVISDQPGRLRGCSVIMNNGAQSSVRIYDSATATTSGKKLLAHVQADLGMLHASALIPDCGIVVNEGIYAVLGGDDAAPEFIVLYDLG